MRSGPNTAPQLKPHNNAAQLAAACSRCQLGRCNRCHPLGHAANSRARVGCGSAQLHGILLAQRLRMRFRGARRSPATRLRERPRLCSRATEHHNGLGGPLTCPKEALQGPNWGPLCRLQQPEAAICQPSGKGTFVAAEPALRLGRKYRPARAR